MHAAIAAMRMTRRLFSANPTVGDVSITLVTNDADGDVGVFALKAGKSLAHERHMAGA